MSLKWTTQVCTSSSTLPLPKEASNNRLPALVGQAGISPKNPQPDAPPRPAGSQLAWLLCDWQEQK